MTHDEAINKLIASMQFENVLTGQHAILEVDRGNSADISGKIV